MTDVILNRTTQKAPNLPDSVDSYHLPDNQTFTGQLMTSESAQLSKSTNSCAVTKASLNQNPRTSDVNSRAVFAWANISSSSGCQFQIFNGTLQTAWVTFSIFHFDAKLCVFMQLKDILELVHCSATLFVDILAGYMQLGDIRIACLFCYINLHKSYFSATQVLHTIEMPHLHVKDLVRLPYDKK